MKFGSAIEPVKLTTTERDVVISWGEGSIIYNTTVNAQQYYNGSIWITVSVSTGTKYHFLNGESLTIPQYFEYFVYRKLKIDSGATITIDNGAELTAHNGILTNFGTITNNGIIEID